jgi:zinc transporter ZupT
MKVVKLQQNNGSVALIIAAVWTGIVHLGLGVLGTFVLKRFPTSFSVGFLLGVLVVLANQNLILFSTFSSYVQGSSQTNHVFASLGFTLFAVLAFMSLLLLHFKADVVVTPMDGKDDEETGEEPTPVA